MKHLSALSIRLMTLTALLSAGAAMTSCHSSSDVAVAPRPTSDMPGAYGNLPGPAALPNACIYRTSIDVDAYVPVTVNPVDGSLISYPAPSDITGASMPVVLKDGWLLDRRGISPNTRFVRYTYSCSYNHLRA
ncbi:MAG: hypothetical protein K2I24_02900, partial [Duncaniella sp.]|nr:hypothetical protein [Duncaniella sp.]